MRYLKDQESYNLLILVLLSIIIVFVCPNVLVYRVIFVVLQSTLMLLFIYHLLNKKK